MELHRGTGKIRMRKNMSLLFREIKVDLFKILLRRVHVVLSHLIILTCNERTQAHQICVESNNEALRVIADLTPSFTSVVNDPGQAAPPRRPSISSVTTSDLPANENIQANVSPSSPDFPTTTNPFNKPFPPAASNPFQMPHPPNAEATNGGGPFMNPMWQQWQYGHETTNMAPGYPPQLYPSFGMMPPVPPQQMNTSWPGYGMPPPWNMPIGPQATPPQEMDGKRSVDEAPAHTSNLNPQMPPHAPFYQMCAMQQDLGQQWAELRNMESRRVQSGTSAQTIGGDDGDRGEFQHHRAGPQAVLSLVAWAGREALSGLVWGDSFCSMG